MCESLPPEGSCPNWRRILCFGNGLKNEHAPEMLFGVIAFEMRKPPTGSKGGRPEIVYRLNEEQATLLMTYLKATYTHQGFTKFL